MVYISEYLPNPVGKDAENEWIELYNSGADTDLSGMRIENATGQKYYLRGGMKSGEYIVLARAKTKLVLHNEGEELKLFAPSGELVHSSAFLSSAPEGKSVVSLGSLSRLAEPTPGEKNSVLLAQLSEPAHLWGTVNPQGGAFFAELLASSILIAFAVLFFTKRNENLSKLFFTGNQEIGG